MNYFRYFIKLVAEEEEEREVMAAVAGGQINATHAYDGTTDVELYIGHVRRNIGQFAWTPEQTANVVKNKLTGGAAQWLRGMELRGVDTAAWPELRTQLRAKYKPAMNAIAATSAMKGLAQRENENVSDFFDRVIALVDLKNHAYTAAQKAEAAYQVHFMADVYLFFSSGMKDEIRLKAMSGSDPPTTAADLLTTAVTVETQMKNDKIPKYAVLSTEGAEKKAKSPTEPENDTPWSAEMAMLTKKVEEMSTRRFQNKRGRGYGDTRGRGRGRGRKQDVTCYNCRMRGHYAFECRQPRTGGGSRGGFPPRGGYGRGYAMAMEGNGYPQMEPQQQEEPLNYY